MKKEYTYPTLRQLALAEDEDFLKSNYGDFDDLEGEDYGVEW